MIINKLYSNVFDAINAIDSNHEVLESFNLYHKTKGGIVPLKLVKNYALINLPNGKICPIANPKNIFFFRGENHYYKHCFASIYRSRNLQNLDDLVSIQIDEIKVLDFIDAISIFPQIEFCLEKNYYIDFNALAQHYGLRTNYIDLTADLITAAFFATHKYEKGVYKPIVQGKGYIRGFLFSSKEESFFKMKILGLQPFLRPANQSAFAYSSEEYEDINEVAQFCVVFKQDLINDYLFSKLFEGPKKNFESQWPKVFENPILPDESEIVDLANLIQTTKSLAQKNIERYCLDKNIDSKFFEYNLKKRNYKITENPLYSLSKEKKDYIKNRMGNKPFGDINFYSADSFPNDRIRHIQWPVKNKI